jgi:hypothetical protein
MAWISFTEDDIKARLSINEIETWDDAGQDAGSEVSRLPGIITQVIGLVRGRVGTCRDNNPLGAVGLIPEELLWAASTIAKNMILNSIPAIADSSQEERTTENRMAHDMLDQASKCELIISGDDSITTATQTESTYGGDPLLDFSS